MKQGMKQPVAVFCHVFAHKDKPIKVEYKKNIDIHQNLIDLFILKMKGNKESTALTEEVTATKVKKS